MGSAMDVSKYLNGDPEGEGDWYGIPETTVQVRIKNLKPKVRRDIVRACTTTKIKRGNAVQRTDDEKLNRLMLQHCVVDWKNIEMDGKLLEVNEENKRLLDDNVPEFSNLWNAVIGEKNDLDEAIGEIESKN